MLLVLCALCFLCGVMVIKIWYQWRFRKIISKTGKRMDEMRPKMDETLSKRDILDTLSDEEKTELLKQSTDITRELSVIEGRMQVVDELM